MFKKMKKQRVLLLVKGLKLLVMEKKITSDGMNNKIKNGKPRPTKITHMLMFNIRDANRKEYLLVRHFYVYPLKHIDYTNSKFQYLLRRRGLKIMIRQGT